MSPLSTVGFHRGQPSSLPLRLPSFPSVKYSVAVLSAVISISGLFLPPAYARLPEPDAVYYGQVSDSTGAVTPTAGQIVVKAMVNGVTLASNTLSASSSAYLLKIPMDDGLNPRLSQTAKAGDTIHIIIENPGRSLTFEAAQTVGNIRKIGTDRGPVSLLNLSVSQSLQFTDTDMSYATWRGQAFSGNTNAATVAETADPDHDGRNNLLEYALGLNPNDSSDSDEGITMKIVTVGTNQHLRVTFRRRTDDPLLTYQPMISSNGVQWATGSSVLETGSAVPLAAPFEEISYRDLMPGARGQPRYFKLSVTRN